MTGKAVILDWKAMAEGPEKYAAYLASPEWAVKKIAVRKRSGGICEWCKHDPATEVHHQTYLRKYNEPLTDLLDVCRPCHAFKSGRSKEDPREYWREQMPRQQFSIVLDDLVRCPKCLNENVHLGRVRVEQGTIITTVTREQAETVPAAPHPRRGSVVCVDFLCECDHDFTWILKFHKGATFFRLANTLAFGSYDGELWRD